MKTSSGAEKTSVISITWVISLETVSWVKIPVVERSRDEQYAEILREQSQPHVTCLQESISFMNNSTHLMPPDRINIPTIVLFTCLLLSFISCKRSEVTEEDCQSEDDLYMIAQSFDTCKYADIDFLISFTSNDSWGTYANSIKIFRQHHEYKLESSYVLKKFRSSIKDTTTFETILPKEKIDSLLNKVNQLGCHAYRLGNTVVFDGNNKHFTYKNGKVIKGWMWHDGILSATTTGERFVDSMLVKALALEGMLYRYAGAGEPKVVYSFESVCVNDSIRVAIYHIWGDNISQSISANHPKYRFIANIDGYVECTIHCRDTAYITKDLEVISTTKESKKIYVYPKQYHEEY